MGRARMAVAVLLSWTQLPVESTGIYLRFLLCELSRKDTGTVHVLVIPAVGRYDAF